MVIDRLENLSQYASLHPRFPQAFAFLRDLLASDAPDGHHVLAGTEIPKEIYVNLSTGDVQPRDAAVAESHRKYIDVQLIVSGEELMCIPSVTDPEVSVAYNGDKDCCFYAPVSFDECYRLRVPTDSFVIFFAGELHAPSMAVGSVPTSVRKAVLKVLA